MEPGERREGFTEPGERREGIMEPGERREGFMKPGERREGFMEPGERREGFMEPGERREGFVGVHIGAGQHSEVKRLCFCVFFPVFRIRDISGTDPDNRIRIIGSG
jgi:hypothetical protein